METTFCVNCGDVDLTGIDGRAVAMAGTARLLRQRVEGLPVVVETSPCRIDEGEAALGCHCTDRISVWIEED